MFRKLRTLLSDSFVYGASGLLGQLVNLLLLPLYTRRLQPSDYGVLAMLAFIPPVVVSLASAGFKSAIFQQFYRRDDVDHRRRAISTALLSVTLTSAGLLLLGVLAARALSLWLVGDESAVTYVQLTLLTATVSAINEVSVVSLQAARRAKAVGILNIIQVIAQVTTTIYLVAWLRLGVLGVVIGGLIGAVVFSLCCFFVARRDFVCEFDTEIWREMSAYARPFLPHRLLAALMIFWGDYSVRTQLGVAEVGLYSVALKIALPIGFISGAVQQAWNPFKFKIFAEDTDPSAFFRSTVTYYVAFLSYLWLGVSLWGPEVVRLMTAPAFHDAALLIWTVALMRTAQAFYPMMATGVELSSNTRSLPRTSFASLIAVIVASLILVPQFGAYGAALATTIAWATMAAGYFFIAQQQVSVDYDWKVMAALFGSAAAMIAVFQLAHPLALGGRLAIALALSLVYPFIAVAVLAASTTERPRMQQLYAVLQAAFNKRLFGGTGV